MSRFTHLTPRYIADRLRLMSYERSNPEAPWLTPTMNAILASWLKPTDKGVEWGSGRSTAWIAARVARLFTVEDSEEWGSKVQQILALRGLADRAEVNRVPIRSEERNARARYVTIASTLPEGSQDFCLIDGDLRDHCALAAISLLKPGGILIIDNVERYLPRANKSGAPQARSLQDGFESIDWERVWRRVEGWRSIWTTSGVTDTALWVKPHASPGDAHPQ